MEREGDILIARVGLALLLGTALARTGSGEASPFDVRVLPGLDAATPGKEFPVAVILEIAPGHKIYADSVGVSLEPGRPGRLAGLRMPPPLEEPDPAGGAPRAVYESRTVLTLSVEVPVSTGADGVFRTVLTVRFQGCSQGTCFLPESRELPLEVPLRTGGAPAAPLNADLFAEATESSFPHRGLVLAMLTSFGLGLLLSLTPCVYPLIPVTLAIVGTRRGEGGWAKALALSLLYVLGLSLTYSALGMLAAAGGRTFGELSTHPAAVLAVAATFLAFAASLFGVYDLELPQSWQAALRMRRSGGALGVLLLGALSGLVASPCIAAPVASVLLYAATTGNILRGGAMLFALAWGMGAILVVAGTFSGLMAKLPKAGGWMLGVKTALGVMLVAASLYFARPLLPDAAFTAWCALPLAGLGLWLGVYRKSPGPDDRRGLALRAGGLVALVFGLYFGVGALVRAGMPAPLLGGLYPRRLVSSASRVSFRTDYSRALDEARANAAPAMIEFVLPNCPGCRELEERVFSREDVALEAERFVRVRVDLSAPQVPVEEIRSRYRVFGAPAVVWIDSAGAVRYDLTVTDGQVPWELFLERMRLVR